MKSLIHRVLVLSVGVSASLALAGCAGNDDDVNNDMSSSDSGSNYETTTGGEELPEFDEGWLFESAEGLRPIYFAYDSYELRGDALAILQDNAEKIKRVPGVFIQIEGHCDERGTQEYNLTLGEKRALATRSHLIKLGVSGDRIITISYGEEDPADPGHSDAAWARNRRCEFNRAM